MLHGSGSLVLWQRRRDVWKTSSKGYINPWGHFSQLIGVSPLRLMVQVVVLGTGFPNAVLLTSPGDAQACLTQPLKYPKASGIEIISGNYFPPHGRVMYYQRFSWRTIHQSLLALEQMEAPINRKTWATFLKSKHISFRPVDITMGPGLEPCMWADWVIAAIIQHGEVDFRDQRRDQREWSSLGELLPRERLYFHKAKL